MEALKQLATTPNAVPAAKVRIAKSPAEMVRLRSLWEDLSGDLSIFQSYLWSQTAAWVFASRERPHVVAVETDSGIAIIPAVVTDSGIALLGEELFDYRDVLADGDSEALRNAWRELAALGLPLSVKAIRGHERATAWQGFPLQPFADAPCVSQAKLSADELRAGHRKLGRFARRLQRGGIEFRRHSGGNRNLVREIYERRGAQSNGTPNLFADPLRREFMLNICALDRRCEIFTYESETELVAALVTFRHRGTRHFYTTYFDPKFAAASPGQVLLFEVAALSLEENLECDFMTGSFPYKDRLATGKVPLFTVNCDPSQIPV